MNAPHRILLSVLGLLALASIAHADIYQCPDSEGRLRYRDTPCAGEVPPLRQTPAPAPVPAAPPAASPFLRPALETLQCAQLGEIAATIARGRNNGTVRLRMLAALQRPAPDEGTKAFLAILVNTIYASDMSLNTARQVGYDLCMRQGR